MATTALQGADDVLDLEVAVRRPRWTNAECFIRQIEIVGAAVGFAENGYGFDAHLAAGPNDAKGNLTSIRYQNSFEHASVV